MSDIPMEDWAGEVGDRWLAHIDRFESMLAPIGNALIATAQLQPGEKVADVGCGGGPTTFAIAAAVAPHGYVTGIDIAPKLIALANRRRQTYADDSPGRGKQWPHQLLGERLDILAHGQAKDVEERLQRHRRRHHQQRDADPQQHLLPGGSYNAQPRQRPRIIGWFRTSPDRLVVAAVFAFDANAA